MRIRKSASRLLGSAYSASASAPAAPGPDAAPPFELPPQPPPPHLVPCSAPEYCGGGGFATASGEPCELSRSPWDLIAELSLSDPQVEDDLLDKYFVHVACRASWLFTASMPAASVKKEKLAVATASDGSTQPRREVAKKVPKKVAMSKEKENKEGETKKKAKVKKEDGEDGAAQVWKCKKNDGKRWHCHRIVSRPNTLCKYHFEQKRSYLNPEFASAVVAEASPPLAAASKPAATSFKPRKKKSSDDFGATEGFYYYAGFGPFRSKRHCRSTMHDSVPAAKQEEEEEPPRDASPPNQAQADDDVTKRAAAARDDDVSSCDDIAGIAGGDEESSDDGLGTPGRNMNGNVEHRVGNGDLKTKNPWKRWRKPVKARSLKSLM
ncbi:uncharacterized protein LOC133902979 [Phragmites australis]|uniref:uncharacterized protein LOC133902979 n=1 Tax=Phragmites australis TaxID=29695 RepID=UPI002D79EB63|nr:uncharacterized protein LOC133902979 [Phragmites australis]